MTTQHQLPVPTPDQRQESQRLASAYRLASRRYEKTDQDRDYLAQEAAWDAHVDWIEAQGLNWTTLDPRGPLDANGNRRYNADGFAL